MFGIDDKFHVMHLELDELIEPEVATFATEKGLAAVADKHEWSREDLETIWNGFAGTEPFADLKPVKKFRNRPYGVAQIWKVIQRLASAEAETQVADAETEAPVPKAVKRSRPGPGRANGELRKGSKSAAALELLRRENGVSRPELEEKFGWLPHTVRGFISTLGSKHGIKIASEKHESRGQVYKVCS